MCMCACAYARACVCVHVCGVYVYVCVCVRLRVYVRTCVVCVYGVCVCMWGGKTSRILYEIGCGIRAGYGWRVFNKYTIKGSGIGRFDVASIEYINVHTHKYTHSHITCSYVGELQRLKFLLFVI